MATFTALPITEIPKRLSRGRSYDADAANALLALVQTPGQAASDGVAYDTQAEARKAAGTARRLLVRVAPDADLVRSRVYADGEKHRWALSLATEKPKARKAK